MGPGPGYSSGAPLSEADGNPNDAAVWGQQLAGMCGQYGYNEHERMRQAHEMQAAALAQLLEPSSAGSGHSVPLPLERDAHPYTSPYQLPANPYSFYDQSLFPLPAPAYDVNESHGPQPSGLPLPLASPSAESPASAYSPFFALYPATLPLSREGSGSGFPAASTSSAPLEWNGPGRDSGHAEQQAQGQDWQPMNWQSIWQGSALPPPLVTSAAFAWPGPPTSARPTQFAHLDAHFPAAPDSPSSFAYSAPPASNAPFTTTEPASPWHPSTAAPPPIFQSLFPFDHSLFSPTNMRYMPDFAPTPRPFFDSKPPISQPTPVLPAAPQVSLPAAQSLGPRRIPSPPSAPAHQAPAKRVRLPKPPLTTSTSSQPARSTASKKVTKEEDAHCSSCSRPLARLLLRATKDEFLTSYAHAYQCFACSPDGEGEEGKRSAVFRKRTKRADGTNRVSCDVCLKDIATGAVIGGESGIEVEWAVEVVCVACTGKYRRCSDCGGGGGARLGVGKWRAKELFTETRKTCKLSHTRLGLLSDMCYDIWAVRDIPSSEKDFISEQCGAMFRNTMLAGMAIPEVMETQSAVATTFPAMEAMATVGWTALQQLIRVDIEPTRSIRRYVALRTCIPNPRKGNRTKAQDAPPKGPEPVRTVIQNGKELAGVILCEYDLVNGTLFFALVMPWATGETYDATTLLIQELLRRVEDDRLVLNASRSEPYPEVLHVWTMMFFKRDSRMMYHLIKRRGFVPFDEYVEKYPETNRAAFAPIRPVYLPLERQAGWVVLVHRQLPGGGGDADWKPRSSVEQMQGKRKEKRGQARKMAEEARDDEDEGYD